jgi:hypothetical protein
MRAGLVLACLALCSAGAALSARPSDDASLRAHLQARFHEDRANYPDMRYVSAWADLDRDGRPEAIVYLLSGATCGTGGCNLMILTPAGRGWRQVADISIVNPPVRLLATSSHGWRDLAVTVAGGGARAHEALLRFGGRTYPGNPSVPPARVLRRAVPGPVLIADGERGHPLSR